MGKGARSRSPEGRSAGKRAKAASGDGRREEARSGSERKPKKKKEKKDKKGGKEKKEKKRKEDRSASAEKETLTVVKVDPFLDADEAKCKSQPRVRGGARRRRSSSRRRRRSTPPRRRSPSRSRSRSRRRSRSRSWRRRRRSRSRSSSPQRRRSRSRGRRRSTPPRRRRSRSRSRSRRDWKVVAVRRTQRSGSRDAEDYAYVKIGGFQRRPPAGVTGFFQGALRRHMPKGRGHGDLEAVAMSETEVLFRLNDDGCADKLIDLVNVTRVQDTERYPGLFAEEATHSSGAGMNLRLPPAQAAPPQRQRGSGEAQKRDGSPRKEPVRGRPAPMPVPDRRESPRRPPPDRRPPPPPGPPPSADRRPPPPPGPPPGAAAKPPPPPGPPPGASPLGRCPADGAFGAPSSPPLPGTLEEAEMHLTTLVKSLSCGVLTQQEFDERAPALQQKIVLLRDVRGIPQPPAMPPDLPPERGPRPPPGLPPTWCPGAIPRAIPLPSGFPVAPPPLPP